MQDAKHPAQDPSGEPFAKPAYWDSSPPPEPGPASGTADDPQGLPPTRYGDWVKNGIAIDF